MNLFLAPFIAGQFRHVLTAAAGYLVAKGVLATGQGSQFVEVGTAIAMYGVAVIWSAVQKYRGAQPAPEQFRDGSPA